MRTERKPRVVYEQYVLAHYSVPLFEELAKYVDLLVVVDKNTVVDGLKNSKTEAPFRVVELEKNTGEGFYHQKIIDVLEEFKADVFMSFIGSFKRILRDKEAYKKIKSLNIKIIAAGCDGYDSKNHVVTLLKKLLNPKMTLGNIRRMQAISRIDKFLMYSSRSADYLRIEFLVPRKKIYITGNAIDTSVLNETFHEARKMGEKPAPYKLVFCGRLIPSKKPDILIKAFSKIINKFPEATLDVIGDGSERENLEKLSAELNIKDKVDFFEGIYDDKEIAGRLCKASLYIMPGLGGLGLNTAMACGLPIVYTDADGTEEDMLRSNGIGWYFDGTAEDLAKKITDAFSHPEKMKSYGEIGEKLIVGEYSIKNMISIYMRAINK